MAAWRNLFACGWFGVLAAVTLVGCSTKPAEEFTPTIQTYADDYQALFQRVSTTAKRCFATKTGLYQSGAVDADVFPDLGYGQLNLSLNKGGGADSYFLSVRIERQPTGSKLTMISNNTAASQRYRELISGWASGDQNCPAV